MQFLALFCTQKINSQCHAPLASINVSILGVVSGEKDNKLTLLEENRTQIVLQTKNCYYCAQCVMKVQD